MSRTTRTYWTDGNWREVRKGGHRHRVEREAVWDSERPGEYTLVGNWSPNGPRAGKRGGMLMSRFWRDEMHGSTYRRCVKHGEEFDAISAAWAELYDDHEAYDVWAMSDYERGEQDFIMDDYYGSFDSDAYHAGYFRDFSQRVWDEGDW